MCLGVVQGSGFRSFGLRFSVYKDLKFRAFGCRGLELRMTEERQENGKSNGNWIYVGGFVDVVCSGLNNWNTV